MDNEKKYIRFINSSYETLFYVPDGGEIKVHSAWDGKDQIFACKHLDSYHVSISGNCYHICQFAEMMERNGNTYEPVKEIGDLDFYPKRFYDRENVRSDGSCEPYYDLVSFKEERFEYKVGYCLNPLTSDKSFCFFKIHDYDMNLNEKAFSSNPTSFGLDSKLTSRIKKIALAINEEQASLNSSLDSTIKACQRSSELCSGVSEPSIKNQIDR